MFVSIHASHRMQPSNPDLSAISTHTPLAGCNDSSSISFLIVRTISTHTPLAGCNLSLSYPIYSVSDFNPCTQWGATVKYIFLPTTGT